MINQQSYFNALQKLLPHASYDRNGQNLSIELSAEGKALDTVNQYAQTALNGITPFYADELLSDWERVLGLPINLSDIYQKRLDLVLQKLAEMGGLSIPYFIGLAQKMGYAITIVEGASELFRAGVNRAGDPISSEASMWLWRVYVHGISQKVYYFRAGVSRAGDRLSTYTDPVIESVFNDLKPAFTLCVFSYEG